MILTPSDVASLTNTLTYWEYAEYASGALVAVACIGEYIASFKPWFTGGNRERKERLEKRSTLLLIVALTAELICLVRTNQLSGQVIGALDTRAAEAYHKSDAAVTNADNALRKVKTASDEADSAKNESGIAKDVAGKASALVNTVRTNVASLGADVAAISGQAKDLSTNLAEANRKAVTLETQLINVEVCNAPRVLPSWSANGKTSVDPLKSLAGTIVFIEFVPDNEARRAALNIAGALTAAKVDVRPLKVVNETKDGVEVQPYVGTMSGNIQDHWRAGEAADELVDFLHSYNWQAQRGMANRCYGTPAP